MRRSPETKAEARQNIQKRQIVLGRMSKKSRAIVIPQEHLATSEKMYYSFHSLNQNNEEEDWHAPAGPLLRSVLLYHLPGLFVMIGALVFPECPLRLVIRLGGGAAGLPGGRVFLKRGFSLGRAYPMRREERLLCPIPVVMARKALEKALPRRSAAFPA